MGNNVVSIQKARDKRAETRAAEQFAEFTPTTSPVDIRTSQLPSRVVDDDGELRLYPAVQHDSPIDDQKAARSRKFKTEPIAMSAEMSLFVLLSAYGSDVAARMLRDADRGDYVFGQQTVHEGSDYRHRIGWNVASDKSRESGYVLQLISFRQHVSKTRKA